MRRIGVVPCAVVIVLINWSIPDVNCELISLTAFGVVSAFGGGMLYNYNNIKCRVYECCQSEKWMPGDLSALRSSLSQRVYGQPLVLDTVVRAIRSHWANPNPKKALVLSFHGWTGCGKNHVSSLIAEALYTKGMHSAFVHLYLSTLHFNHHDDEHASVYASQLRDWIIGNMTLCERSMFVFDELDKLNPKVLEGVKPFIDHHQHIRGVDYRKSIFIFLSNTGAHDIAEATISHEAKYVYADREHIKLADMESLINRAAFNEQGGLQFSSLIEHNLIDHFVPFLPLRREHVKLCIRDYLLSRDWTPTAERINKAADQLQYYPPDSLVYSKSGCKRIPHKVDLIMQEEFDEQYEASKQDPDSIRLDL